MSRAREIAIVIAIVGVALALRGLGLRLGLPYFHHWDETLITSSARGMLERGDDVPSNFFYGAPLMRLTVVGYKIAHTIGLAPIADEITLRWVGRTVSVLIASSGAAAAYLTARATLLDRRAAVVSALLYATAQELVWHARFAVTDASVVSLTAWTLALSAMYLQSGSLVVALAAIVTSGLCFSFKLTGLATLMMPVGALLLRRVDSTRSQDETSTSRWQEELRPLAYRLLLAASVPLVVAIFLALNPHVRLDWRRAFADFEGIARHYREGHVKPFCEREPGVQHLLAAFAFVLTESTHTSRLIATAVGLIALFGLAQCIRKPLPIALLGTLHAVGIIFSMAWPNRAYLVRQYLPALPILCLGFGAGAVWIWDTLGARAGARIRLILPLLALVAVSITTYQSIESQRLSSDARVRAIDHVISLNRDASERSIPIAYGAAVYGGLALGGHGELRPHLDRRPLRIVGEVATAEAAARSSARYVVVASHRNLAKIWPYEEQWAFTSVPGFHEIARFEHNPYEHRLDLVPTWDGYVSAIVLERDPTP